MKHQLWTAVQRATSCLMRCLLLLAPCFMLALSGCSYTYEVKAVVIGGRLAFVVDPNSRRGVSCINQIDVIATGGARARPAPGDDVTRVRYGTFWHERLDYNCADEFPIYYGQHLTGKPMPLGQAVETVAAKPLKKGVVYEVTTTTGTGGYGGGAFKIMLDGTVANVSPPPLTDLNDPMNPVAANDS
jgi:hypothetical protein